MDGNRRRGLGGSGIMVSPLAMGCWSFGGGAYWGKQSRRDEREVVASALDHGLNLFDTAEMYNGGASEEALGRALAGRRSEAVIASKISPANAYREEMIACCEASLRRLKTDYLDVYMLHWPLNRRSVAHFTADERKIASPPAITEAMEAMAQLKADGKIRAAGVSNFGVKQLREAAQTGVRIDINEITYNILSRAIEAAVLPYCRDHGVSVLASMTLAQGLLAGLYSTPEAVPPSQAHSRHFAQARGGTASRHGGGGYEDLVFSALADLKTIAAQNALSLPQMAIAWLISRPGVTAALVGSRSAGELAQNRTALDVRLSQAVMNRIDRASLDLLNAMGSDPDYYENSGNSRIW
jgi:aryl-alcohol dehydrogenase-like predicted oxidoreductase